MKVDKVLRLMELCHKVKLDTLGEIEAYCKESGITTAQLYEELSEMFKK